MEARRDEFRNYLETSGAITALTNVLIKLFELPEKPENSIKFICKNLGGTADLEQENEDLKLQLADALRRLENSANRDADGLSDTRSDIEKLKDGLEKLKEDDECDSLLKHFLTEEWIDEFSEVRTELGSTLLDCLQFGFHEHRAPIGFLVADADCYNEFQRLLDPIIRKYHGIEDETLQQPNTDWGSNNEWINPDPEKKYILKSQVNCYRSLQQFPFFLKMEENQYVEIMEIVQTHLNDSGLNESYYALEGMLEDIRETLGASNTLGQEDFLFDEGKQDWDAVAYSAHWPKGRAVYFTDVNDMALRVNHKSHFQFGCVQVDGDLQSMWERFSGYAKSFEEKLPCIRHEMYGWITPFPELLGTAMEISVVVKLHNLPKDSEKFKEFLHGLHLKSVRVVSEDDLYYCQLKNARCFGLSEIQVMEEFIAGLVKVFKEEEEGEHNS